MVGALREWLAASKSHTMKGLSKKTGLSISSVYGIFQGRGCRAYNYDVINKVVPVLWERNYCEIAERPGGPADPKKIKAQQLGERDHSFRRIRTPSLDDFAGIPGGWC